MVESMYRKSYINLDTLINITKRYAENEFYILYKLKKLLKEWFYYYKNIHTWVYLLKLLLNIYYLKICISI